MTKVQDQIIEAARVLRNRAGAPISASGLPLPALLVMTDEERLPDPVRIADQLPAGCGIVLRHYGAPNRTQIAQNLKEACHNRGILFFVARDAELAISTGAHGLHVPEGILAQHARPMNHGITTIAAHSASALERAAKLGADAAILSPVFPTESHPSAPPLGAPEFARLVALARVPVYALGGVNPSTIPKIADSGAAGVAVTGMFAA